jgi:hypothetical protein
MAQQSSDALSARAVLLPAARVIMIHVDELPFLKRLVAHRARGVLRRQNEVELFLGQSITSDSVLPVGFPAGLLRLAMWVGARVLPLALHRLGCLAGSAVARRARTRRPLSRHPLTAQVLSHMSRLDPAVRLLLRHALVRSHAFTDPDGRRSWNQGGAVEVGRIFEKVGALGFEPRTSRL